MSRNTRRPTATSMASATCHLTARGITIRAMATAGDRAASPSDGRRIVRASGCGRLTPAGHGFRASRGDGHLITMGAGYLLRPTAGPGCRVTADQPIVMIITDGERTI